MMEGWAQLLREAERTEQAAQVYPRFVKLLDEMGVAPVERVPVLERVLEAARCERIPVRLLN